jgi:hypothetical protein
MNKIQMISLGLAIFLVVWMTLLALGKIKPLVFWIPMIISAFFAYKVLPGLKK